MLTQSNNMPTLEISLSYTPEQMAHFRNMQRQRGSRPPLRVLIVEDQMFSRKLLYEVLQGAYTVEAASTVGEGWTIYLDKAPDIVFLDIELSDVSGHALARRIKQIDPASFVVMVTANRSLEDVNAAKENRVDGFIVKPFSRQKVQACIKKYAASGFALPQEARP